MDSIGLGAPKRTEDMLLLCEFIIDFPIVFEKVFCEIHKIKNDLDVLNLVVVFDSILEQPNDQRLGFDAKLMQNYKELGGERKNPKIFS